MTLNQIITATAEYFGIPEDWIRSMRKTSTAVRGRQICVGLARRNTVLTTTEIMELMNGQDHTAAVHAMRVLQKDKDMMRDIHQIEYRMMGLEPDKEARDDNS